MISIIDAIFIKAAANTPTYQDLQRMYSPEELEGIYDDPSMADRLPPKPTALQKALPFVTKMMSIPEKVRPISNILTRGWASGTKPNVPIELLGG